MNARLLACLLAGLLTVTASAQSRSRPTVARPDATAGVALISAPNTTGGYLCPGCLGYAALDAEIEPDNPLAPVRVRVEGIDSFVWLHWKRNVYFEVPAEIEPGRSGMRWLSVEIEQGERRFVGAFPIVSGAPVMSKYIDGTIAGLWQTGDYSIPQLFWFGPPQLSLTNRTRLLFNVTNLGVETLRRGTVEVWLGAHRFVAVVGESGFPGTSAVTVVLEPGRIAPGDYSVRVRSGRWTENCPPLRLVGATVPVNQ